MTTTIEIVKQLGSLSRDLDESVKRLGEYEEMAVDAEADYKLAEAKAFRDSTGNIEERKRSATIDCDALFRTWGKAASLVRVQKEHLRMLHARIEVGRTVAANARAEYAAGGLST